MIRVPRTSGAGRVVRPPEGESVRCPVPPPPEHHEELRLALMDAGRRVRATADDLGWFPDARDDLVRFCSAELLPHLAADERWLQQVRQCPEARLLADAIRTEARAMTAAVYELAAAPGPYEAVAATRVLHALLAAHTHHVDELVTAAGT